MQVYGILEKAQLENVTSDLSNTLAGLVWANTTDSELRYYDGGSVRTFANLDKAQTFTNKTITGGVFDVFSLTEQGSTPATPSSGTKKMYAKTDGTLYTLDSNGNEIPVGSGSGGGSINFEDKGDFESSVNADFTVSAGTLSFTTSGTEVGDGNKSFKFVPAASGDTVERDNLPVPLGYRQNGRMFLSGVIKCADDVIIRLKDKTNTETFIEETIPANSAYTPFEFSNRHQVSIENVSWEIESTGTGIILIDGLSVSPFGSLLNSPIEVNTEWESFTPTLTDAPAFTTTFAKKRRQGRYLEIQFQLDFTAAGGTSTVSGFILPDSLLIDPEIGNGIFGNASPMGYGFYQDASAANTIRRQIVTSGQIGTASTNKFSFEIVSPAITITTSNQQVRNNSIASGDRLNMNYRIPIKGWSDTDDNITTNSDSVAPIRYSTDAAQSIPHNTSTTILYEDLHNDDDGLYNPATGIYTVPKNGWYQINAMFTLAATAGWAAGERAALRIEVEGATAHESRQEQTSSHSNAITNDANYCAYFQKGDEIKINCSHTNGGAVLLNAGSNRNHLSIFRIDKNPIIALGNETCFLKDVKTSGLGGGTFTSGAFQTRDLNTIEGSTSFCSLSGNQFTIQPGKYLISASAPGLQCNNHQAFLRNITDSNDDIVGSSAYSQLNDVGQNDSKIEGEINITSAKVFEIRHRCSVTRASYGFGSGFGVAAEVYTQVKITKLK